MTIVRGVACWCLSGAKLQSEKVNHVTAGDTGLWLGEVDDLWSLGKPSGVGGPWKKTRVKKDQASDPYLMLGYEQKTLVLNHDQEEAVEFEVQVDVLGTGDFATYQSDSCSAWAEVPASLRRRLLRPLGETGCQVGRTRHGSIYLRVV